MNQTAKMKHFSDSLGCDNHLQQLTQLAEKQDQTECLHVASAPLWPTAPALQDSPEYPPSA